MLAFIRIWEINMKPIKYALTEVSNVSGKPYRLGFLLVDARDFFAGPSALRRMGKTFAHGSLVYHYTSLAGLQGIIQDGGVWASDHRFMNDTEEFEHGVEITIQVLTHCQRRPHDSRFSSVIDGVLHRLTTRKPEGNLVACFSIAQDSLEQWRGYGGMAGVALELGGHHSPSTRPLFYGPDLLPRRVIYDDRAKAALSLQTVRLFEDEYRRDRLAMPSYWPDDHDDQYVKALSLRLLSLAALFKGKAFQREEEVRVVLSYESANRFGGVEFRPSPLGLIPFVNTGKRSGLTGKLPLQRVIVGPSQHQASVLRSLRTFLDLKGYTETTVCPSQVPYRNY